MPPEGKTAVVILRAQALLGLLCCTGLGYESLAGLSRARDSWAQIQANLAEHLEAQALAVSFFVWLMGATFFRALLAHEIAAGKPWARTALLGFEVVGIAFGVATWLIVAAVTANPVLTNAVIIGSSPGMLTAATLIGLVRTHEMRRWCRDDR